MSHTRYDAVVDKIAEVLRTLETHNFTMELSQEEVESLQAQLANLHHEKENLEKSDIGV